MARRLYLMQRFDETTCDPDGGLSLPAIALSNCQAWRGFGAYNTDGTLASPTPSLPSAVQVLHLRGRWHLVCVEATDFTWFDANGHRVPGTSPFTNTLTTTQRNQLRTRISGTEVDVSAAVGEPWETIITRLCNLNLILEARGIVVDIPLLWNSLDAQVGA